MTPVLVLDDVTVSYASAAPEAGPALSGVSLRVEAGELMLVAGRSGCGKSTLMRVINGLVPHAYRAQVSGSVVIAGSESANLSIRTISETVGTLLQNPAKQVVGQTVRADLAFGLENRGMAAEDIEANIRRVASTLGLDDALLAAATHELSGGQLQLVAFAGILVLNPSLIVIDEPLANLDPEAADRVLRAVREYVDGGGAAIVIEHRVAEVVPFAPERVIYLENGSVSYSGDLDGFLDTADPEAVSLPFATLVGLAHSLSPQTAAAGLTPGPVRVSYTDAVLGYGTTQVLAKVDADLRAGQRIGVLGRNGAGKSTLLRAAVGLVDVAAGSVRLVDRAVADYSAAELAALCGYLFQNPAQALFAATVADELAFGPRNLGFEPAEVDRISAEVLAAVGLADIPGILDRPPRTLSFGEQRRLALALALSLKPRVLILDEPTAGQDERSSNHFLDAIWALPSVDSVYFITHDVDLALWRSDRILVIDSGSILADGPPIDIVHDASLWHSGDPADATAVLRETDYVRAVRTITPTPQSIPPPHELARTLSPVATG